MHVMLKCKSQAQPATLDTFVLTLNKFQFFNQIPWPAYWHNQETSEREQGTEIMMNTGTSSGHVSHQAFLATCLATVQHSRRLLNQPVEDAAVADGAL